jgi:protein SCO1/2
VNCRSSVHRRLTVVVLAATIGATACKRTPPPPPVLPIGGDFTLTDHNGERFSLSSQRGKVVLIFFGYTYCPDACPTTLSKLASVAARLGPDRSKMKTLYISVDPERDTPAVLKADLANFSVDAVGLTGTRAEIDTVVSLYGAAYEITPTPESAAKYSVAHTTTLYALDGEGRVRVTFPYEAGVNTIVDGIKAILASAIRGRRDDVRLLPHHDPATGTGRENAVHLIGPTRHATELHDDGSRRLIALELQLTAPVELGRIGDDLEHPVAGVGLNVNAHAEIRRSE